MTFKQEKGKQITGTPVKWMSLLNALWYVSPYSCKTYNIITSDDDRFCEVFGEMQETDIVENTTSRYYGQ